MQDANYIPTKSSFSEPKVQLIELMQRINFGRIEALSVRRGKPALDPPPRVVREIKFGGENGARPEVVKANFMLKAQVRDLFAQMEAMGDGIIRCLEVKHGLPFKMTIEEEDA
jgi:hypothetical protein